MYNRDILTKVSQHTKLLRIKEVDSEYWDYYDGNHFKFWIGSMPPYDDPNREKVVKEIENAFISANLIKECIDRHVNALISDFPEYSAKSLSGEEITSSISEKIQKCITEWLDASVLSASQEFEGEINPITLAVTRMLVQGKSYLRLFARKRYQNSPDAYKKIALHSPVNGQIRMNYDDEGSLESIEYIFDDGKIERQELDPVTGVLYFSIYDTEADLAQKNPSEVYDLDLNYNWSIFELKCPSLITKSVKTQQNGVNLVLTMLGRNVIQAGFLERLLMNAQSPGEWVENTRTGDVEFIPDPKGYVSGAGAVSVIKGLPIGDDPLNPEGYTTPSAVFREPVNVDTFEQSLEIFIARLYQAMGQGHILTQGDGSISGVSRIQLSQDFSNSVKSQVKSIQGVLSKTFYSAIVMLSTVGNELDIPNYKQLSINVELNLSDHLVTPEEHKEVRDDFTAGIISHETTLQYLGVDDVVAELEKLAAERKDKMAEMEQQIELFTPPSNGTATKPTPNPAKSKVT